jgi:PDDEXK-like domain of unknown function (DUF3799)
MLNELTKNPNRAETYFREKAINNSLLSQAFNPYWIRWKLDNPDADREEFRYFRIGSAVDCLLTDADRFNELFFVFTQSKPSGLAGKFIDNLPLFALNEENEPIYGAEGDLISFNRDYSLYQEAYNKAGYRIPIRTVIQNFWSDEKQQAYYRAREQANGKQILSTDEMEEVVNALEAIKANPFASKYFTSYTQVPIYWDQMYKGKKIACKGLLDFIYIDHEKMKIYPGDLKTTASSVTEFEDSFWKYSYYRQCAWYMQGLVFSGTYDYYLNLGYEWEPFRFIVASKKKEGMPALIYEVSGKTESIGAIGGKATFNGKEHLLRGHKELFEAICWHQETGNYSAPKFIIDNNYTYTI